MMEDTIEMGAVDDGGWKVTGVLTDLSGAMLTLIPGEAGLAGTVELEADLRQAANEPRFGRADAAQEV